MKRLNAKYFFPLLILFLAVIPPVHAAEDSAVSEEKSIIKEALESVSPDGELNKELKAVGSPLVNCPGCAPKGPDKVVVLDGEEVDIGNPYYRNNNEPYVIYLKRTSKSPNSIELKFKNGHKYCAKMYAGNVHMECTLYFTHYNDEKISLNLKNLPKLAEGQEEVIELTLIKPNTKNSKYELKVKSLDHR